MAPEEISVTEFPVSLVTQMVLVLPEPSATIPTGEVKEPEKVVQEEQEGEAPDLISVTSPEEVSSVTQMLLELSAAIPTGEEKEPEKVVQEEEGQEVAPGLISVTSLEVLLVTQMLPDLSEAIPAGVNPTLIMGQAVKLGHEVVP